MSNKRVNALLLQYLLAFLRGVFGTLIVGFLILGIIWLVM